MATMVLLNNRTGDIYGYFGTPFPTIDDAIKICFPDCDWNNGYINDPDYGQIYIDDFELMIDRKYVSIAYNETWTLEEIANQFHEFWEESKYTLKESIEQAYEEL